MIPLHFEPAAGLKGLRLAVAGAGVLGLSCAVGAALDGARVTVFDPAPVGENASGVAAGMLAPGFEALLDGGEAADHALLDAGYGAWPAFADALGLPALPDHHAGALYVEADAELERMGGRLSALGVAAERLGRRDLRLMAPDLAPTFGAAIRAGRDGRLDAPAVLAALAARLLALGGEVRAEAWSPHRMDEADATLLAGGFTSRDWAALAPPLARLQPIKGHVLHFAGGPAEGPTLRSRAGYAAPQHRGLIFGATMEPGVSDLRLEPGAVAGLHAAALDLLPGLAGVGFTARTGIRAATPDRLPLAGPAGGRLHLATGARRNGWLLAPLVASTVIAGLRGRAAGPNPFDPLRFQGV